MLTSGSRVWRRAILFQRENSESFARESRRSLLRKTTCSQYLLQSLFVEISMVNSTTFWNYSKREDRFPIQAIFLWEIWLTEDSTQSKLSNCWCALRSSIHSTSLCLEETMSQEQCLALMDSMMKTSKSTVMWTHGNTALMCSTTCALLLVLKERSCAFTEDSLQTSRLSTKSETLTESKKCLTMVHSLISCGLTQKKLKPGPCLQEEPDGFSVTELPLSSVKLTALTWSPDPISLSKKDTSSTSKNKTWSLSGLLLTTATDAPTSLPFWKLQIPCKENMKSSTVSQTREPSLSTSSPASHTSCDHCVHQSHEFLKTLPPIYNKSRILTNYQCCPGWLTYPDCPVWVCICTFITAAAHSRGLLYPTAICICNWYALHAYS